MSQTIAITGAEARKAKEKPKPEKSMIFGQQRFALIHKNSFGEITHPPLHPDHRKPENAGNHI